MSDEDKPAQDDVSPSPAPIIRAGCVALLVLGTMTVFLAVPGLLDAGGVRCSLARTLINNANQDDKEFNDVDTGGKTVEELECPMAIQLAGGIRKEAKKDDTLTVPSESTIRIRSAFTVVVGAGQAASGLLTLRTLGHRARLAALVFATLGMLFPALGLFSLAVLLFALYALAFSAPSREIWPRPQAGRAGS
jgi:hypothetical protein